MTEADELLMHAIIAGQEQQIEAILRAHARNVALVDRLIESQSFLAARVGVLISQVARLSVASDDQVDIDHHLLARVSALELALVDNGIVTAREHVNAIAASVSRLDQQLAMYRERGPMDDS